MNTSEFIPISEISTNYQIEVSFFNQLQDNGLIKIITYKQTPCIALDAIQDLEKMIRMHHELNINIQGIDIAFNLLQKVEKLQNELNSLKNKLRLYEDDF